MSYASTIKIPHLVIASGTDHSDNLIDVPGDYAAFAGQYSVETVITNHGPSQVQVRFNGSDEAEMSLDSGETFAVDKTRIYRLSFINTASGGMDSTVSVFLSIV